MNKLLLSGTVSALVLLPLPAEAQSPDENASSLFEAFLSENGEDIDGCFDELVELQSGPYGPDLKSGVPTVPKRVLIAVDASGSMAGAAGNQSKMEAAKVAVESFHGSLPKAIEVGLVAFGHTGDNKESGRERSCKGVEVLAPVGSNPETISAQLKGLSATGWTPLAAAIETAGTELEASDIEGEQVVYVVSDGEETCGGDPVAAARTLNEGDIRAIVNIIGLDLPAADREALEAVAGAGGGVFEAVSDGNELFAALGAQARNIGEMTRVRAMSGHATRANNAAVGGAMLRVNTCVAGIVTRENRQFRAWRQTLRDRDVPREILDELDQMRRERHDEARVHARNMSEILKTRNDTANEEIRKGRDAAEEAYDTMKEATDN
jgi:Ca-activated chloride channel family protein